MIQYKSINISMEKIGRRRKSIKSSMEILNYPGRNKKILRNFVLFLKKVHSWEGVTEMVHGSVLLVL